MSDVPWLGPAIDVRPLLVKQQRAYIEFLHGLSDQDWQRPTVCPGWTVKDIVAHVLGDHIGRLSIWRDDFQLVQPSTNESFSAFIHRINDEWVTTTRRISPRLLTELSSSVGDQIVEYWQSVDLNALGWPVSWAGPDPAPAWFDAARDFTEYWTHQQQICEATGRVGLVDPEYLGPVLDIFMRALPHTLKDVNAPQGTTLRVIATGPGGGAWTCTRTHNRWVLRHQAPTEIPVARLELDADTTWRLCTRNITPEQAAEHAYIAGDQSLANTALNIVSIIS